MGQRCPASPLKAKIHTHGCNKSVLYDQRQKPPLRAHAVL